MPNNLSGIYFRYKNPESGEHENWCFEDLPKEKQLEFIETKSPEWLRSMVLKLAETLKNVGDEFGIKSEN